jgi:DNA-binding SARP family transcriptional activator
VEFGLLGPVVVRDDAGQEVGIGGPLPRALLAVLLLAEGRLGTTDSMLDQLWDGAAPDGAQATLHSTGSLLRKILEPDQRSREPAEGWPDPLGRSVRQ